MKKVSRRSFSKEFKISAVKMIIDEGRKATEVARQLGIAEHLIYNWKRKYQEDQQEAFPGNGNLKSKDEYIRQLEKDVKRLKDERDILKKATIFFAKEE
jgi:transposase